MKQPLINKLDTAWSERIRQYGRCEVCGKTKRLNAHHFYSRSIRVLRWDVNNGFCLCVGGHVFSSNFSAHKTPAEFFEWAIDKRGRSWYNSLKKKKRSFVKYIDKDFDFLMQTLLGD